VYESYGILTFECSYLFRSKRLTRRDAFIINETRLPAITRSAYNACRFGFFFRVRACTSRTDAKILKARNTSALRVPAKKILSVAKNDTSPPSHARRHIFFLFILKFSRPNRLAELGHTQCVFS
jgi:hypothetical protein